MVRAAYIGLTALVLAFGDGANSQEQPHRALFEKSAKQIQGLEQNMALFSATGSTDRLLQSATDSLKIAETLNGFSDLPIAYRCGFAAVRLSQFAINTASGQRLLAAESQHNYLTLMDLCEQELHLPAPAKPNLR